MRRMLPLMVTLASLVACKPALPELETSGKYVRWGAVPSHAVACDGLAARADSYVERAHALLGLEPPDGVIAHYYFDPDLTLIDECADAGLAGCAVSADHRANRNGDVVEIYATEALMYHELGHAIHMHRYGFPESGFLAEAFAELMESGDGYDSWEADSGLAAPLDDLIDSGDFEQADAQLAAYATASLHGTETFAEFFAAAMDAETSGQLESIHESVTGEAWSATVATHGPNGCDLQPAHCSGPILPAEDGIWRVETPGDCDDHEGAIGPLDDRKNPVMEVRRTIELPTDGEYLVSKDTGVELELVPCGNPCGPDRESVLVLASFETSDPTLQAGTWEMVARYFRGEDAPKRIELALP